MYQGVPASPKRRVCGDRPSSIILKTNAGSISARRFEARAKRQSTVVVFGEQRIYELVEAMMGLPFKKKGWHTRQQIWIQIYGFGR